MLGFGLGLSHFQAKDYKTFQGIGSLLSSEPESAARRSAVASEGVGTCFWVSGFGFRVSGFGLRVSGFEVRVSGFGFRVTGFGVFVRVEG